MERRKGKVNKFVLTKVPKTNKKRRSPNLYRVKQR